MSGELDDFDLALLARAAKRPTQSAAGRREKETRMVSYSDRRRNRATGRTEQMNLRVRPEFKRRLIALSENSGLLMVEIIERGLTLYEQHEVHK